MLQKSKIFIDIGELKWGFYFHRCLQKTITQLRWFSKSLWDQNFKMV